MKVEKILKQEDFIKWLDEAQDSKVVGNCKLPRSCPVSTFLLETQDKIEFVSCGPQNIYIKTGKPPKSKHFDLKTPEWAARIIDKVDNQDVMFGEPITKEKLILLMEES